MVCAETSRRENIETENNPEQVVENAVSAVEAKDAAEGKSWWSFKGEWPRVKEAGKDTGKVLFDVGRIGLGVIPFKIAFGLLKFAKEVIAKKGQVGFGKGFEIGQDMFSFDGKKDKK